MLSTNHSHSHCPFLPTIHDRCTAHLSRKKDLAVRVIKPMWLFEEGLLSFGLFTLRDYYGVMILATAGLGSSWKLPIYKNFRNLVTWARSYIWKSCFWRHWAALQDPKHDIFFMNLSLYFSMHVLSPCTYVHEMELKCNGACSYKGV